MDLNNFNPWTWAEIAPSLAMDASCSWLLHPSYGTSGLPSLPCDLI